MKTLELFIYLLYCIPPLFFLLSRMYMLRFNRLRDSGKITDIISTKQRQTLYFLLGVLSTVLIIITKY
ncbi:MAG: hypothetical protein EOP46_19465 [Sphingobacteriaceae bacterium]|nr:MAG: hypothetical protein EOP46_19465 [Sphingobacteriaceae bacterium]